MKICVTGKKGSGKSTFINILEEKGFKTLKADDFIHEIYNKDNIGYKFILNTFGDDYINDFKVNRKKLNNLIMDDLNSFNKLNNFTLDLLLNFIKSLDGKWIIELGIYLNHSLVFKNIFHKVILIENKNVIDDKSHISSRLKIDNNIKFDYIIHNNEEIDKFKENIFNFLYINKL